MDELEMIQHPQIHGLNLFFDTIHYRASHVHPELELLLVLEKPLIISCDAKCCRVEPGQLALFQPNQPHEVYKEQDQCTLLCMQVSPALFSSAYPLLNRIAFDDILLQPYFSAHELQAIGQKLMELARCYLTREQSYELLCIGNVALLLYQLLQQMPKRVMSQGETRIRDRRNDRLLRMIEFVNQNYMHKIRLTDFAELEHLSVNYLSGFIKETMNQSFQSYVDTVRFNAARKQIASGCDSLIDVCLDCGFSDYRYFSRAFRTRLGITPAQYQQQCQQQCPPSQEQPRLSQGASSMEQFYSREQSLAMCDRYG